jgi:hypothetical protein
LICRNAGRQMNSLKRDEWFRNTNTVSVACTGHTSFDSGHPSNQFNVIHIQYILSVQFVLFSSNGTSRKKNILCCLMDCCCLQCIGLSFSNVIMFLLYKMIVNQFMVCLFGWII